MFASATSQSLHQLHHHLPNTSNRPTCSTHARQAQLFQSTQCALTRPCPIPTFTRAPHLIGMQIGLQDEQGAKTEARGDVEVTAAIWISSISAEGVCDK